MIPFLLIPVPLVCYLLYSSFSSLQKEKPGVQIITDLTFASILSCSLYFMISPYTSCPDLLHWLGLPITLDNYGGLLSCSSIIFVFYIGPLVQTAFIEDEGAEFNLPELKSYITDTIVQELLFRVCSLSVLLTCGLGYLPSVLVSALIYTWSQCSEHFSVFAWQNAVKNGAALVTLRGIFAQLLFAVMLGYMYVRTGSLIAVILVHVFKNFMGFPDLEFVRRAHRLFEYRIYIALAYLIGIVGGGFLFKLILMDPELFHPWLTSLY